MGEPRDMRILAETGPAALLFILTFLLGGRIYPLRWLVRDQRSIVSAGAGMSAACVFVHLMPELHGVRLASAEGASMDGVVAGLGAEHRFPLSPCGSHPAR